MAKKSTDNGLKTGELIAQQFRKRIVEGDLKIGERLPSEEELTQEFGIARTTLREALRVLESEGLIRIRRGRGGGPEVTRPTIAALSKGLAVTLQMEGATIGDLDEARQLLEPSLARKLAANHSDEDLREIQSAIDFAADAVEKNDRHLFGVAAANMHLTILVRSGNPAIATLAAMLNDIVSSVYIKSASQASPEKMLGALKTYKKLQRFIVEGRQEEAEEIWRALMKYTISNQNSKAPLKIFNDK